MTIQFLDAVPLTTLSGVGAAISDKLGRIGIHNLQDLLFHLPIRYEDCTRITPIHDFVLMLMLPLRGLYKRVKCSLVNAQF